MFFAQPRAKKRPTVERPFYRKKRRTQIEEIEFKPDDREEYLTGFRKRKQQREIEFVRQQAPDDLYQNQKSGHAGHAARHIEDRFTRCHERKAPQSQA